MLAYYICAGLWAVILGAWVLPAVITRRFHKLSPAVGVGAMLSLVPLMMFKWGFGPVAWLRWLGFAGYIPATLLVIGSAATLALKTGTKTGGKLIDTGVFGLVRHPMFLGTAMWAISLVLVIQNTSSLAIGAVSVFFLWLASKQEEALNLSKFGQEYEAYTARVPFWNLAAGIVRSIGSRGVQGPGP